MAKVSTPEHRLIEALNGIEATAQENIQRTLEVQRKAAELRIGLASGEPLVDLVRGEDEPRVVELISTNLTTLATAGAELRAAKALALRAEGLTIDAISDLFGVTRQRISALLKQKTATGQ